MARFTPEPVEVTAAADLRANIGNPLLYEAPGGLYPLRSKAFELDEYRICAGWPVPVPRYDIFARTMVSGTGERFTDRLDPGAVRTNALTRWIPDPTFYDTTALRWSPVQDDTVGMYWESSSAAMPTLISDYTYRLGAEVFTSYALNFDSDTAKHLWIDMSSTLGGSTGYTVLMVMSPNSIYGNDDTVPYNGLWCPGYPSPGTDTFTEPAIDHYASVTVQGNYLYYGDETKERTRAISVATNLTTNAPTYVAMVFSRPEVVFYVGEGPDSVRIKRVPTNSEPVPLDGHVTLGRTPGDILHTADLALLDLSVYGDVLTGPQVITEFALLAQSYGGVPR